MTEKLYCLQVADRKAFLDYSCRGKLVLRNKLNAVLIAMKMKLHEKQKAVRKWTTFTLLFISVIVLCKTVLPGYLFRILSATGPTTESSQHYQLVEDGIENGDTFRVTDGTKEVEVQLCGIDAPEKEQPFGRESRNHLAKLINQGNGHIILVETGSRRNGSIIAEAFVPIQDSSETEIHLNSQMLIDGMAYLEPESSNTCSNGHRFAFVEEQARAKGTGIWALENLESPLK